MEKKYFKYLFAAYFVITFIFTFLSCAKVYEPVSLSTSEEMVVSGMLDTITDRALRNRIAYMNNCRHPISDSMYLMNTFFPYVLHEFLSFGYDIYTDPFGKDQNGVNSNIYAVKKGADTMKAPVIVSAHWDTPYEYPGADDNASGCTALLEIASVLSGVKLERNVMFIMFGVEEIGFLGAYAFMKRFKNQPPHILVNLDGIAYTSKESSNYNFAGIPKTNDFILIAGMRQDRDFAMHFCDIIDQFVPDLRYYCLIENEELVNNPLLEHLQSSDHVVFWGEKQHALFITDTGPIRDPFYHTPDDTVGTLDFNFFRNVTAATAAFVYVEATR
jgi:hypothetical protein